MHFPQKAVKLNVQQLQLIDSIEVAAASLRELGNENEAISLFRLRIKIREGIPFEGAKTLFEKLTTTLRLKKNEHLV